MAGNLKVNSDLHGFSQADLLALFECSNGKLLNKVHRHSHAKSGTEAGYVSNENYRLVTEGGKTFGVHRAIFLMHHGYLPDVVDHINGNPLDNRIENLRAAAWSDNTQNAKVRSDNTTGVKGVTYNKEAGAYVARVQAGKTRKFLGRFESLADADEFISLAREMLHGTFANHGHGCVAKGE